MDEGIGPVELEFIINNPELTTAAGQAEATMQAVTANVQAQATKAAAAITSNLQRMQQELEAIKVSAAANTDPLNAGAYTRQISILEGSISRIKAANEAAANSFKEVNEVVEDTPAKVGKVEAAISRVTNIGNIGARVITQFSRQIIGLGVGFLSLEIGAKAIKSLVDYISQLNIFNPVAKEAEMQSKAFSEALVATDYTKAVESITQLRINLQLAKEGFIDKDGVIDEYNNSLGKAAGKVDTLDEAEQSLNKNADAFIRATLLKAAAQIVLADAAKDAADTAVKNQKIQDDINKLNETKAEVAKNSASNPNAYGGDPRGVINAANKDIQSDTAEINDNNKRLAEGYKNRLDIIKNFDKEQAALATSMGQSPTDGGSAGTDVSAIATLRNQLDNDALERKKIQSQNIISDDQKTYATRLAAVYAFYNASKGIAENNEKLALSDKKLSADQRLHIENEYGNTVLALQKTRAQQIKSLRNDPSIAERAALLQQVSQAEEAFNRKSLSSDQAALQAVEDKYNDLRSKITAFNNDPKNAGKTVGAADISKLNTVENTDIDNQANLNENAYIEQDIEKKKKLYADYTAYKEKLGTDAANAEYADLLQSGKDFATYLNNISKSIDATDQSGPIQQRRELVKKAQQEDLVQQLLALQKILEATQTTADQKEAIEDKYQRDVLNISLNYAGQDAVDRIEILKATKDKALDIATELAFEQSKIGLDAAQNLTVLSSQQLETYVAMLKQELADATNLTPAQIKKIRSAIQSAQGLLGRDQFGQNVKDNDTSDSFKEIANLANQVSESFSTISQAIQAINPGLAQTLTQLSDIAKFAGSAATAFADFSSGNIVGGISSSISAITGLFSAFSNAKQNAAQAAYSQELEVKAIEEVNAAIQRQIDLSGQLYGTAKLTNYASALANIKIQTDTAWASLKGKLSLTGVKQLDDLITGYNQGSSTDPAGILGLEKVFGGIGKSVDLATLKIDQLQKLLGDGKLDAKTGAIVQSLITLQQQAIDTQNALNQALTGTSIDDLTSGIVELFQNATTSAQDFAGNFTKIIQDAILKGFETKYLDHQLQGFYDDLAALTDRDGTLTKDDIAKLQKEYQDIIDGANTQFQQLQKATGETFTPSSSTGSPTTLSGQIQGITAEEANELGGALNGLRLTQLLTNDILTGQSKSMQEQLSELRSQTLLQIQIAANTKRTADTCDTMAGSLKSIDRNTSGDALTNLIRAAGHG